MNLKKLKYNNVLYTVLLASITSACGGGSAPIRNFNTSPPPPAAPTPAPAVDPVIYDTAEFQENFSLKQMNAQVAYLNGITGDGVIVAIIDSGVTEIPELNGQLHTASTNVATGNDADVDDYNGHGTAMAAIIAAKQDHATNNNSNNMHGVAYNAEILAINATTAGTCTDFSNCTFLHADIAKGYTHAIANEASVINESLGSDSFTSLTLVNAMKAAVAADIVIVLPAGNGDPTGEDRPQNSTAVAFSVDNWDNEQIIIAGSVDDDNTISSFSYKAGPDVEAQNVFLVAGGNEITTAEHDPAASNTYIEILGTSAATAQISGAVALLRQAFPSLDAHDTADLLFTTATDLGDPAIYGRGLVNLEEAFTSQGMMFIAGTGFGTIKAIGSDGNISNQNMLISGGAFGADISFGGVFKDVMVLDKYDRSFNADLSQGIYLPQNSFSLDNFIESGTQIRTHSLSLNEKASVKMAWRTNDQFTKINKQHFNYQSINDKKVNDLRISLTYDLGNNRTTKFASGMSMAEMLDDYSPDDYMAPNKHGFSSLISANHSKAVSFRTPYGKKSTYEVAFSSSNVKYDPLLFSQNITVKSDLVLNRFRHNLTDNLSLTFDLGMLQEKGSVLGSVSRGALEIGKGAKTTFTGAKLNFWLSDNIEFFANATYGMTKVSSSASGILGNISTLKSYSYLAGIKSSSLLTKNDQLSFTVSQPLRISGGTTSIGSVISRDYQTNQYNMAYNTIALSPSATERDIELSYSVSNIFGASMRLNVLHQINPGHTKLIPDTTSVLFRIGSAF